LVNIWVSIWVNIRVSTEVDIGIIIGDQSGGNGIEIPIVAIIDVNNGVHTLSQYSGHNNDHTIYLNIYLNIDANTEVFMEFIVEDR